MLQYFDYYLRIVSFVDHVVNFVTLKGCTGYSGGIGLGNCFGKCFLYFFPNRQVIFAHFMAFPFLKDVLFSLGLLSLNLKHDLLKKELGD